MGSARRTAAMRTAGRLGNGCRISVLSLGSSWRLAPRDHATCAGRALRIAFTKPGGGRWVVAAWAKRHSGLTCAPGSQLPPAFLHRGDRLDYSCGLHHLMSPALLAERVGRVDVPLAERISKWRSTSRSAGEVRCSSAGAARTLTLTSGSDVLDVARVMPRVVPFSRDFASYGHQSHYGDGDGPSSVDLSVRVLAL